MAEVKKFGYRFKMHGAVDRKPDSRSFKEVTAEANPAQCPEARWEKTSVSGPSRYKDDQ